MHAPFDLRSAAVLFKKGFVVQNERVDRRLSPFAVRSAARFVLEKAAHDLLCRFVDGKRTHFPRLRDVKRAAVELEKDVQHALFLFQFIERGLQLFYFAFQPVLVVREYALYILRARSQYFADLFCRQREIFQKYDLPDVFDGG